MYYHLRDATRGFDFTIIVESEEAENKLHRLIQQMGWTIVSTE
jgi:hypothetical protein